MSRALDDLRPFSRLAGSVTGIVLVATGPMG